SRPTPAWTRMAQPTPYRTRPIRRRTRRRGMIPFHRTIGLGQAVQFEIGGLMDSRISARSLAGALGGWRTRTPTYEALADGIRLLCLDNRIAAHPALPAERELAVVLGISRSTVAAAY